MKILDRMSVIRAMIPTRGEAHDLALRWKKAARVEPELAGDLIRLGGVLSIQPDEYRGGLPSDAAIDPLRAAYQKGRRDMAVQILALMGVTHDELKILMEEDE
ncbi:MAG: hypothetical protein R3D85_16435 [Paracoccaceae bacterium]|nr:hypothetical protein [Paracoccaceae bacterium]MCB2132364.1 hypothetical protein [Paracoccaceae bacterium]MCB2138083.1 hypothetical protein [Paracoccaceae bacterium]MCB2159951.1 hypothetical protein [Paracoccaceae bacterium]